MSFFAILIALLLEQARPLARSNLVQAGYRAWTVTVRSNFDAGRPHHGWLAWAMAVLLPSLIVLGIFWALMEFIGWPAAMLWNVAVLYVTLGFRQFSHHFTRIRDALDAGDEFAARQALADWQQVDASEVPRSEVVRHVIEYSVLAAHRHVFGVLFWFSILSALGLGPLGAILYRMAEYLSRAWSRKGAEGLRAPTSERLHWAAAKAWYVIDWLPARLTALSFAMVGSFEEAIDNWRVYAQRFPNDNDGVILAATAGAINVRLGGEALRRRDSAYGEEGDDAQWPEGSDVTPGREPEMAHLRSVVGLVWRSVVVWLLLLALLTFARLLG
ncbi:Cobalamin biosynthesis protein CbiB [Comamonas sp. PE63]|uniref:Cobalamin biosynthesis protein CobD n=1 Tax=Comamonas brasiliensis TaxID=1812482 RepID=A0ABS5LUV1_9BURK|nr:MULTISPECIES: CobD/CbiB family protein [unclassified Comamonas]MBS3020072.1 Cobalamin biosynthesis protein CbiB [Comamonas sp. PE63]NIF84059.1 CobD/CbiB family protein [Comamonas sp. Tr-654]